MAFVNSVLVQEVPQGYTDIACGFPLRLSIVADEELDVAVEVTDDWKTYVSEDVAGFMGTLGPMYAGGTAIALPEVPPERFSAVAYCIEMFFLIDDVLDGKYNLRGAEKGASFHSLRDRMHKQGLDQIYGKFYNKLAKIDRKSAAKTLKFLSIYEQQWHGAVNITQFDDIGSYLEVRMHDVGQLWFHSLVVFAWALDLSDQEEELLAQIRRYLWYGIALVNDLCSVDKELKETGFSKETNAVFLIMDRDGVDLETAKETLREIIRGYMAQYRQDLEETRKSHPPFSPDLKKAIEANELGYSGSAAWSLQCYRYQGYPGPIKGPYSPTVLGRHAPGAEGLINGDTCPLDPNSTSVMSMSTPTSSKMDYRFSTSGLRSFLSNTDHHSAKNGDHETSKDGPLIWPFQYTQSLPSGGLRKKLVSAFNTWLQLPEAQIDGVENMIDILHGASLMLDDIEDESFLRRGQPPAHSVFGFAQTINSSNFQLIRALKEGNQRLSGSDWLAVFTEELESLFQGQALDLYWAHNLQCTSVEQYYQMIDGKTGGMIRLLVRLLESQRPKKGKDTTPSPDLSRFATLFGRYFQVYDDYRNMSSTRYAKTKGEMTDIEEGHFSLPMILAIQADKTGVIRNVVSQRHRTGGGSGARMSDPAKNLVLCRVKESGALEVCVRHLETLKELLIEELQRLETAFGVDNFALRLIIDMVNAE